MSNKIVYVGLDVDDTHCHGAALNFKAGTGRGGRSAAPYLYYVANLPGSNSSQESSSKLFQ